jgi:hypothetical protein
MKVGDKVKYLGGSDCCSGFNVGDVVTIKCTDETFGYYPVKIQHDNGIHGYCAIEHLAPLYKFKIGDNVELLPYLHGDVIENGCNSIVDDKVGKKGTIDGFDSDGNAIVYLDIYPKDKRWNSYTIKPNVLRKMENQMTKDQLKTGMWVVTRNACNYMVARDTENGSFLVGSSNCIPLGDFKQDLTYFPNHDYDIMKVYGSRCSFDVLSTNLADKKLLWTRPAEVKEISKDEVFRILKDKFGCDIKITE